jgi:hypothetical protein
MIRSKRFFFKKKNQKTFGRRAVGCGGAKAHGPAFKVFLVRGGLPLFVHKKNCFPFSFFLLDASCS